MNRAKEPHAKDPRKLDSGRWQARVTYYDAEMGKRRETSQTFATEREAQKWSREEEQQYRTNPNQKSPSQEKIGEFFDRWLRLTQVGKASPDTVERYGYDIRHITEHLGNRALASIGPQDIYQFYQAIYEEGMAAGSIDNIAIVLRTGFKWAVKTELLSKNPTDDIHPPRPPEREHVIPSNDEVLAFLTLANTHRLRGLWIFLVLTGVRIGEALGIRWSDIDWNGRRVLIQRALKKIKGRNISGTPKDIVHGKSPYRRLPCRPCVSTKPSKRKNGPLPGINGMIPGTAVAGCLSRRPVDL